MTDDEAKFWALGARLSREVKAWPKWKQAACGGVLDELPTMRELEAAAAQREKKHEYPAEKALDLGSESDKVTIMNRPAKPLSNLQLAQALVSELREIQQYTTLHITPWLEALMDEADTREIDPDNPGVKVRALVAVSREGDGRVRFAAYGEGCDAFPASDVKATNWLTNFFAPESNARYTWITAVVPGPEEIGEVQAEAAR